MRKTIFGFAVAVFLGLMILGAGCSFDEPINPRWDMQLVIPLSEQRYTLQDLVDTSTALDTTGAGIALTTDSLLYFFYQDSIPRFLVGDSIYLPPQMDSINSGLKDLSIETGLDQGVSFTLGEINPWASSHQGETIPVPAFDFIPITKALEPLENLQYADIDSGYLNYSITNNFPVPVQNVVFRMSHTQYPYEQVVTDTINSLGVNETTNASLDLHGTRIFQELSIKLSGSSPGSSSPVEIDITDSIVLLVNVGEIKVIEVVGKVPAQTAMTDSMYALNSGHEIHEAGIQQGTVHLQNHNDTELSATLRIRLSDFTSPQGDTLETETHLEPNSIVNQDIIVDGYTLRIANPANQALHIIAEAIVDPTTEWVHYQKDQDIYTAIQTDTIYLSYVDGILGQVMVDIEPQEKAVEQMPEGWEQLNFVSASLSISLESDISAPITTNIHFVAWREGSPRDSILVQETIVPNQDTSLVIPGLEQLLDDRPDTLKFWGTAEMSGDLHLEASNYFQGILQVDIPISFTATPTTINGDIQETNDAIDQDKQVNGATVETTIHNHLPLSGSVVVLVAHDSTLFRTNPSTLDTLISITIARPTISGGRVTEEAEFDVDIALTDEQIDWFRTVPVYTRAIFHLDGTEGDTLSAYGSDYLGFSAIGRFIYEVDTE